MSYDLWLEADLGGPQPVGVTESENYTSNVSGMWSEALGYSLRDFDGKVAGETIEDLRRAIRDMEDNHAKYREMNPPNGWGNAEGACAYLRKLLTMALTAPKAVWRVSS